MTRFTVITLGLCATLLASLVFGGSWSVLGLIYITVFAYFMDKLSGLAQADQPGKDIGTGDALSTILALIHPVILYGAIHQIASSDTLDLQSKILIFLSVPLFLGQVSNSNAHELIHRSQRHLRRLGMLVYCSILFGHHCSAHLRVHHVHAATDLDPNSARLGEPFYRFALRAWVGSLRQGYAAEKRLHQSGRRHPYLIYAMWGACSVGIAFGVGGGTGVLCLFGLSAYAQLQLLLSDYVQHYGLRRHVTDQGRVEPVGPQHSWNAPHPFTSAMMLNAPRHSDHHTRPGQPYPGLHLNRSTMPILPYSLPMMAVIALAPPLWRKVMDRRAKAWAEPGRS